MIPIGILLVIFGFVGFIVKWAMEHEQEKLRIKAGHAAASSDALTESELRRLIREAVDDAVTPLRERLDRLEGIEEPGRALSSGRIDLGEDEDPFEEPEPARSRRRTR